MRCIASYPLLVPSVTNLEERPTGEAQALANSTCSVPPSVGRAQSSGPDCFVVLDIDQLQGDLQRHQHLRFALFPFKRAMCNLTNPPAMCNPTCTCRRAREELLLGVSEAEQIKISGFKLEAARLLTPPIHPRVPTGVVLPALRLITGAGRGDATRSA